MFLRVLVAHPVVVVLWLLADHVVPDVQPRNVSTAGGSDVTSRGDVTSRCENVLDVIDRLSETTSSSYECHQLSLFNVDDEIFPTWAATLYPLQQLALLLSLLAICANAFYTVSHGPLVLAL